MCHGNARNATKAARRYDRKPRRCDDLKAYVASKRSLVRDLRIVTFYGSPELYHHSHHILHEKRTTNVKEVECRIGSTRQFSGEIFGQGRVAENGSSTDRCRNDPGDVRLDR